MEEELTSIQETLYDSQPGSIYPSDLHRRGYSDYSTLAKPFWIDALADKLQSMLELRARREVGGERVRRLERAVRKVTQRVNLFEKVLIPQARENISRIQIHLADAERAAVVRSKIMKANRQQRPAVA